jgi:hypothetical protein
MGSTEAVIPLSPLRGPEQVVGPVDRRHPALVGCRAIRVKVAGQGTVGRLEDIVLSVGSDLEGAVGVEFVVGQCQKSCWEARAGRSGYLRS